jgi:hypothetical protein
MEEKKEMSNEFTIISPNIFLGKRLQTAQTGTARRQNFFTTAAEVIHVDL